MDDESARLRSGAVGERKVSRELDVRLGKATYSPPVLTIYGSVTKLTAGGGATTIDAMGAMSAMASDRAVKENIVRIGDHPLGIGIYLFDYKPEYREQCGHGRQFGVMADEVESVMPQAVCLHRDGYKMVRYEMLGVRPATR